MRPTNLNFDLAQRKVLVAVATLTMNRQPEKKKLKVK